MLGSLRVVRDAAETAITSPLQRRLLAAVAIDAGAVVSSDRLIDVLWADEPPPSADKTLQSHVARLRRALDSPTDDGGCLLTRPPGYLLDADAVALEHLDAARLIERSVAATEHELALELLDQALALWRGPALAEFRDEEFARAEAQRLDDLRARAVEERAARLLALDRPLAAVADLERLLDEHPFSERPVELTMRALSTAGRGTDALRSYERFRARLADELGLEPSPELRALEASILRHGSVEMRAHDRRAEPAARADGDASVGDRPVTRLWSDITAREAEVLDAVADRLSNGEIAERLFISVRTVESHVSALLRKLGAADRRELARLGQSAERTAQPGATLPAPLATSLAGGTFAGRSEELDRILAAVTAVGERHGRHLVVVSGAAGIGKTRLLAEAAATLAGSGATIAFGRCDEEALVPYQPLAEIAAFIAPRAPTSVVESVTHLLRPVVPALHVGTEPRIEDADSQVSMRAELFGAFDRLVSAAPAPVLLVVDDLQWADRPTLLALRHLLRSPAATPVLVAAGVRAESLVPESQLGRVLTALEAGSAVTHVRLAGLSSEQAAMIVEHDFPQSTALARTAWERTDGNPFLLRELMHHLDETGADSLDAVPAGLREVVARRVAHLDPDLVHVLTAAALIGESFRLGVAARAADVEPGAVLDAVEAALRAGLLVEVPESADTYRFAHALVRDALVQRLASSRRLHLHLRIADELERGGASRNLAEIAHHLHAALPEADLARVADVAERAAEQAIDRLAYEQAAALASMVIDVAGEHEPTPDRLSRALATRGEARLRAGDGVAARADLVRAARLATRIGDGRLLARAALGVGDAASIWGADAELVDLLERARTALNDDGDALRARVTARLAQALYYTADTDRRRELCDLAEADAAAAGDDVALAWVLSARHAALWSPEDVDERIDAALRIRKLGATSGHDELVARGLALLLVDLMEAGDVAGARRAMDEHAEVADRLRQPIRLRDVSLWRGCCAMLEGRLDDAERSIDQALDLSRAAEDANADLIYWVQRFWLVIARGEDGQLDRLIIEYERLTREVEHVPAWRAALAYLHAFRGDRDEAAQHFDVLARDGFGGIPRDLQWLNAMTYSAEVCAFLGDGERAEVLFELLSPFEQRVAVVDRAMACKGAVARHLGLLAATCGRSDEAERLLRAALDKHRAIGAVLLEERTARELEGVVDGSRSQTADEHQGDETGADRRHHRRSP